MRIVTCVWNFCLLLLFCGNAIAQVKFASYDNSFFSKSFDISIYAKEKENYALYIDAMSVDNIYEDGGIEIQAKQYQDFLNAIAEARTKYVEWVKTAQDNNVKELTKTMTTKCKAGAYFKYGSEWQFQFLVNLTFDFKIVDNNDEIEYLLIVRTGELESSSNQFMKVDGFVLVFTSAKEIDDFTTAISFQKINDFLTKPKVDELFKE